tara:strand:+ start:176 stop:451 length:276 start_codon:yes stop_codon:yes gene_type:complete
MSFLHRSMYPKRERILYSLANALHEQMMTGGGTLVTPADLRTLCYRGTKLPEEDIELLLKSCSPAPDAAGLVDIKQFVASAARQLQAGEKT